MIDLVVVGGGQAGLAAGAAAAERGLRVTVLEKADRIGGSASLLGRDPVDRARRRDAAAAAARRRPRARPRARRGLRAGGGEGPRRGRRSDRALDRAPRLRRRLPHRHPRPARALGVQARRPAAEHAASTRCSSTAAACAASSRAARRSKRAPCCWPAEVSKVTRSSSSASSAGTPTGSSCARTPAASATVSGSRSPRARRPARGLGTFYGHTVASPLRAFEPDSYLPLAQYHSKWCMLVNRLGRRYTDEALGDEVANQLTLRQPGARGVLLCDDAVRRERVVSAPYPHGQVIDRFEHARALGARITSDADGRGADRARRRVGRRRGRRSTQTLTPTRPAGRTTRR